MKENTLNQSNIAYMSEQNNANGDASNAGEGNPSVPGATLTPEEQVAALTDQNKKLFERAKKAEGFVQDSEGNWVKKQPAEPAKASSFTSEKTNPIDILRHDAFKLSREGYDEDDIELILNNGGREILKNDSHPITLGLKAKKEQHAAEVAAAAAASGSGQSDVFSKHTPEQMKEMSVKDLEKILPHA